MFLIVSYRIFAKIPGGVPFGTGAPKRTFPLHLEGSLFEAGSPHECLDYVPLVRLRSRGFCICFVILFVVQVNFIT